MIQLDRIQQRLFIIMCAIIIILASLLLYVVYFSGDDEAKILSETPTPDVTETPDPQRVDEANDVETIKVYIAGAIIHPGVIELNEGERLNDAVRKAGGVAADADLNKVNLAIKVRDEGMYYIPVVGEDIQEIVETPQNVWGNIDNTENAKVNINTASQSMLETLPNIGPARAKNIIKYREDNGGFKANEDIMKVSGIANKIYDSLKDYICVD